MIETYKILHGGSVMLGSAESKDARLSNREIIFDVFQSMWPLYLNVAVLQTDGRTDINVGQPD